MNILSSPHLNLIMLMTTFEFIIFLVFRKGSGGPLVRISLVFEVGYHPRKLIYVLKNLELFSRTMR